MQAPPINPAHDVSEDVHLSPPFVLVEGVLNCRALPLSSSITPSFPEAVPASKTWILRSGDISRITALGIAQLHSYRIRKIFDLRTPSDIVKFKSPALIIEGVDIVNAPLVQDPYASSGEDASNNGDVGWYSQDNMRKQYAKFREDELRAFMKDYTGALEEGREVIAKVLRSLVNRQAGEGIMFHCNGVLTFLRPVTLQVCRDIACHQTHTFSLTSRLTHYSRKRSDRRHSCPYPLSACCPAPLLSLHSLCTTLFSCRS
jgi:hypothetical protein